MATREQVYAVLIAVTGDQLLLPNAAVAEVSSQEGLELTHDGPDWLIGKYRWNGRTLPAVSFEALNGAPRPEVTRRARLVVINAMTRYVESGYVALLSQGYPHLVTLNRAALKKAPLREDDRADLLLSRVRIAGTQAAIPDLEAIEAELARAGSSETPVH